MYDDYPFKTKKIPEGGERKKNRDTVSYIHVPQWLNKLAVYFNIFLLLNKWLIPCKCIKKYSVTRP